MASTESALFWAKLRKFDSGGCIQLLKQSSDPGSLLRSPCVPGEKRRFSYEKSPAIGQHPLSYIAWWVCDRNHVYLIDDFLATIVDIIPSIASEKDSAGYFPLHYVLAEFSTHVPLGEWSFQTKALMFPARFDTCLLCLIKANPAAVLCKIGNGLPLEVALRQKYSAKVILLLLENSPDNFAEYTANPLRIALENLGKETMEEIVGAVIAKYPEASRSLTEHIPLPLHFAIKLNASAKVILSILLDYPEAAAIPNRTGNEYILHTYLKLLKTHQELGAREVILAMNDAWHDGFKTPIHCQDNWWLLPLHWAIKNNMSSEVILAILKSCPYVAAVRDRRSSWLPLHYAAAGSLPPEVIEALLESYPQAVSQRAYHQLEGSSKIFWCRPIDLMQESLPEASMQILIEASSGTSNNCNCNGSG